MPNFVWVQKLNRVGPDWYLNGRVTKYIKAVSSAGKSQKRQQQTRATTWRRQGSLTYSIHKVVSVLTNANGIYTGLFA